MNRPLLAQLVEKYPLTKASSHIEYGTAGFRAEASLLPGVLLRCGLLTALRTLATGKSCGLIVTASHNPVQDNGVKVVDYNGETLDEKWETHATALVQATTLTQLEKVLGEIQDLEGVCSGKGALEVFVGFDTRPTSPALAEAAKEGIRCLGVDIAEGSGLQTTPQVHFRVWRKFHGLSYEEFQWYKYMAGGYMRMARGTDAKHLGKPLLVDCANGVGADKLEYLGKCPGAKPQGYLFETRNTGDGTLNHLCGADFVQKEKEFPLGFENIEEGDRCASLDGDADRAVFFSRVGGDKVLLDGDKIAALAAIHVKDLLAMNPKYDETLTVGVVQTAYANGASTKYIRETLKLPVAFAKTGVKHVHHEAKKYDIGIYFEANGHGTVLIHNRHVETFRQMSDIEESAFEFLALAETMNQATGDGVSILLMVEAILRRKHWTIQDWLKIYDDFPSVQTKVKVADRSVIKTINADRKCIAPKGLQEEIDTLVANYKNGRSFVRASGTEDIVRVYAEADTTKNAEDLAKSVAQAVHKMAKGIGKSQ